MKKAPLRYRIAAKLLLANKRWLAVKLLELSQNTPYSHIPGYMRRWHLITHPASHDEPGFGTFINDLRGYYPFYVRFHHILRADKGRHLHDHPFGFTSIILKGSYTEERMDADGRIQLITYKEGDINQVKLGEYHRITEVSTDGVVTLVFHDKKKYDSWGFLVDDRRVHWKDYHNASFDAENKTVLPQVELTAQVHEAVEVMSSADFYAYLFKFKEKYGVNPVFNILKEHGCSDLPSIPSVERKAIIESLNKYEVEHG